MVPAKPRAPVSSSTHSALGPSSHPGTDAVPDRPVTRLRPMVRAARIAIFEREVRERLSKAAVEVLLGRADVLSEGQRITRTGRQIFEGSTMLTLDLARTVGLFRESADVGTARRLGAMLARDTWARNRIRQIATKEAERLSHTKVHEVSAEMRVSTKGVKILIDVDVEAKL